MNRVQIVSEQHRNFPEISRIPRMFRETTAQTAIILKHDH